MRGVGHGMAMDRREWMRGIVGWSGVLGFAGPLAVGASADAQAVGNPYAPFAFGIQSYSLRAFSFAEALRISQELGVRNWESYSAHIPAEVAGVARAREAARAAGVRVSGFGVIPFGTDADANRRYFEFGRALGLEYLSADPAPGSFESLDRLVEEYGIAVGIHNHGPGHAYATVRSIEKAIEGHHPRIGCCIDTGHFMRAGEDPVQAVEVFGERVYGVHLKDVKGGKDVVLGQGELRLQAFLDALAARKYRYCLALEYEENEKAPQAEIRACLEAARAACERVRKPA